METELFITIYSNSKNYGNSQIECTFRCLEDFAKERIASELSVIFKRNKEITDIEYEVVAKIKQYVRKKKPFSFIISPKFLIYNLPKNWSINSNVFFK